MSRIEQIFALPEWEWLDHSAAEIHLAEVDEVLDATDFIWRVGSCAVVGFVYHNYLVPPWMWFALAKHVNLGHLLDFRRLKRFIPAGTLTGVQSNFELGQRFAKLYGFEDTGEVLHARGLAYNLFRRV